MKINWRLFKLNEYYVLLISGIFLSVLLLNYQGLILYNADLIAPVSILTDYRQGISLTSWNWFPQ